MILKSWKEIAIAQYLHCGVRSAQRWEEELGLPIRRPGGPNRNVVLAFTEELEEWIGLGKATVSMTAREHVIQQSELMRELRELRSRQRQLVAELRANRDSAKPRREEVHNSKDAFCSSANFGNRPLPTLLTVDDDASQCYDISQVLRHAGFTVFEAHDAAEALEVVKRECPGIVLADIHLNEFTGYELFGMLKSNPRTEDIQVIFYTAFKPTDAASFVARRLGAAGFIETPVEPEALVAFVQGTISNLKHTMRADLDRTDKVQ
jgi:CheY-like chemotaxis protein